jgi:hypothetical protein
MLTSRQLATIRAALRYWQEEMCPHGAPAMRPYLGSQEIEPLDATELAQLRRRFLPAAIRYALYQRKSRELLSRQLFTTAKAAAEQIKQHLSLATVLLPAAQR